MRRLVLAFAGRTYHIVLNIMLRLNYRFMLCVFVIKVKWNNEGHLKIIWSALASFPLQTQSASTLRPPSACCLFVCLIWFFTSHQQSFSYKGMGLPGLTSTKLGLMFLLKNTTQWRRWGSNPRPFGLESSTLPCQIQLISTLQPPFFRERSGSVVECLTRDRRAAGWSLTGVTALWSLSKTHLS